MLFLKQSTASQTVLIGPFVDSTDGVTAETALTIANTDIRLSKNGANITSKNSGGGTHDENGWYQITLDATDTNTVGKLQLHCVMSGALPVWHEYYVLEENVYDAWFGASAAAGTDLASILTDTGTTLQAELDGIQADTEDIQSRLPAALVSGRMSSDMVAISGSTTAADNLEASALGIIVGQAQTGTLSTTQMTTNLSGYDDDRLIGRVVVFTGSPLAGETTDITDYANSSGLVTFTAVTEAPTNGTTFVVI